MQEPVFTVFKVRSSAKTLIWTFTEPICKRAMRGEKGNSSICAQHLGSILHPAVVKGIPAVLGGPLVMLVFEEAEQYADFNLFAALKKLS